MRGTTPDGANCQLGNLRGFGSAWPDLRFRVSADDRDKPLVTEVNDANGTADRDLRISVCAWSSFVFLDSCPPMRPRLPCQGS